MQRIFRVFAISGDAKQCVQDPLRVEFAKRSERCLLSSLGSCNEARLTSCLRGPYVDAPGACRTTSNCRHNLTVYAKVILLREPGTCIKPPVLRGLPSAEIASQHAPLLSGQCSKRFDMRSGWRARRFFGLRREGSVVTRCYQSAQICCRGWELSNSFLRSGAESGS